jgi:2-dehydropantoate 2-reductase
VEEVTANLFPNPRTRPTFWAGIYNTGIYSKGPFSIVLAGRPEMTLGPLSPVSEQQLKSSYLIQNMLRAEQLNATYASHSEIRKAQLLKLIANAMINPLTVLFNCKNGELFSDATRLALMDALLLEASAVARAIVREDGLSADSDEFEHEKLKQRVLEIAEKTAANTSSMLQDAQAGRSTEIDYINGYLVRQGQRLSVPCPKNTVLVDMVKKREVIADADIQTRFT